MAAGRLTTGLTGHRLTPTTQTRQEVLKLGQLNLSLAFTALGMLGEDIENQGCPVDDLDLDDVLERPSLSGAELTVTNHSVSALGDNDIP